MRRNSMTSNKAKKGSEFELFRGELCPIDFHNHGVGEYDFANIGNIGLNNIENNLACEGIRAILCMFIGKKHFHSITELVSAYSIGKDAGHYNHIVGIGVEGLALSSHGGTPSQSSWAVTKKEWKQIAKLGTKGLEYVVFSPDYPFRGSGRDDDMPESLDWLVNTLIDGGVRPAPGHFSKVSPETSAKALDQLFDIVSKRSYGPIITDHLFNDMPLNFKHAWRTKEEKKNREKELLEISLDKWDKSNLSKYMGLVPAKLIQAAWDGLCKICLNFDGDHVDYSIIKKTLEIGGTDNFILMTDFCQNQILAGAPLTKHNDNSLLYQQQGIVACGTQRVFQQIYNMRTSGFSEEVIKQITVLTPSKLLGISPTY